MDFSGEQHPVSEDESRPVKAERQIESFQKRNQANNKKASSPVMEILRPRLAPRKDSQRFSRRQTRLSKNLLAFPPVFPQFAISAPVPKHLYTNGMPIGSLQSRSLAISH